MSESRRPRLSLKDGTDWEVPDDLYRKLHGLYYDVDAELAKMSLWCLGNLERRKTKRGARSFVTRWFFRSGKLRQIGMPASVIAAEAVGTRSEPPLEWRRLVSKLKTRGDK